ncbi:helix-turn-helix domain-containing protein (plasmid) [Paracoccus yeei]|uniref:Helix-turn-helix domain-containing protein n=1 Tax=Paracoccus yeei TaxID=147645 RepID=A0A5P2QM25_9RHOB|nr:helix-turn-helix domain-containing protein [Paracoccus yeei]QEU06546.1 helix-turn-helix domain-containing protein [Paracoccus yeei]
MKVRFSHLSLSERRKIERWRQMKLSPDEMARRLGRHRSTIFRELRRNHFHDSEVPKLEQWRKHYNTKRPHSALGYRPPAPEAFVPVDQRLVMH